MIHETDNLSSHCCDILQASNPSLGGSCSSSQSQSSINGRAKTVKDNMKVDEHGCVLMKSFTKAGCRPYYASWLEQQK